MKQDDPETGYSLVFPITFTYTIVTSSQEIKYLHEDPFWPLKVRYILSMPLSVFEDPVSVLIKDARRRNSKKGQTYIYFHRYSTQSKYLTRSASGRAIKNISFLSTLEHRMLPMFPLAKLKVEISPPVSMPINSLQFIIHPIKSLKISMRQILHSSFI